MRKPGFALSTSADRVDHFTASRSEIRQIHVKQDAVDRDFAIAGQGIEHRGRVELEAQIEAGFVNDLQLVRTVRARVEDGPRRAASAVHDAKA